MKQRAHGYDDHVGHNHSHHNHSHADLEGGDMGGKAEVSRTIKKTAKLEIGCNVPGHYQAGMRG